MLRCCGAALLPRRSAPVLVKRQVHLEPAAALAETDAPLERVGRTLHRLLAVDGKQRRPLLLPALGILVVRHALGAWRAAAWRGALPADETRGPTTRVQSKVRSLANLAAASATCQPAAAARRSQARRGAHPPQDAGRETEAKPAPHSRHTKRTRTRKCHVCASPLRVARVRSVRVCRSVFLIQ